MLTPTTVWRVAPRIVLALDEHLGSPVDSYVNGTQTWLTEDGPGGATLEWRLHPVAAYRPPAGLPPDELWETVISLLVGGADPEALALGGRERALDTLWDGLECFCAYGEEVEPAVLATAAAGQLGIGPDGVGLVDHEHIGSAWERSRGEVSIVQLLLDELGAHS